MPGSQLLLLTVSAAVLLVPAAWSLLAAEPHRHLAEPEGTTRRVRMVVAATLAALGSLVVSALAGAGPAPAATTAVVLAAALLCWTPLTRAWAVRGVVTWALLVVGAVAGMGWLLVAMFSSLSGGELFGPAAAWALGATVLVRVRGWATAAVGRRASLSATSADRAAGSGAGVPGALLTNVALVAAGAAAVALIADGGAVVRWATPPHGVSTGGAGGSGTVATATPEEAVSLPSATGSTRQPATGASAAPAGRASATPRAGSAAPTGSAAAPAGSAAPTRRPTPVPITGVPAGVTGTGR